MINADCAQPEWTKVNGQAALRIGGSKYAAQPITGRKNARWFDVYDIQAQEYLCQISKGRVRRWLIAANDYKGETK